MASKIKRRNGKIVYQARPRGVGGRPVFLGEYETRKEAQDAERLFKDKRPWLEFDSKARHLAGSKEGGLEAQRLRNRSKDDSY